MSKAVVMLKVVNKTQAVQLNLCVVQEKELVLDSSCSFLIFLLRRIQSENTEETLRSNCCSRDVIE